jgi:hypothetical protein
MPMVEHHLCHGIGTVCWLTDITPMIANGTATRVRAEIPAPDALVPPPVSPPPT